MALSKGDTVKLIDINPSAIVLSDWLNAGPAATGDIAVVEEASASDAGIVVRLPCESKAGFLEWRATFLEARLVYELLLDDSSGAIP